ncbi:MAG TPA: PEPxxWA-CTERM sorting domain-containing protein [Phenylobacterium sp.]|jgi:hypothetical protein
MFLKISRGALLALAFGLAGTAADAAALLTSSAGYTGPSLDLSAFSGGDDYTFSAGPFSLPGGIGYQSDSPYSALGTARNGHGYFLGSNGYTESTPIIGSNGANTTVTLTFAAPVGMFGAGFNYTPDARFGFPPPFIRAFDAGHNLIAEYNLAADAPISTPHALEGFAFRGIDGGGVGIASFEFQGAYVIASGIATASSGAPEPAAWALMIAGFGLAGAMLRRRRAIAA